MGKNQGNVCMYVFWKSKCGVSIKQKLKLSEFDQNRGNYTVNTD